MRTYRLVAAGLLAGLSLALQLVNSAVGIPSGWGMTVDLVGLPILLALFILGYGTALEALLAASIGIALIAQTGVIGAVMKFSATLPMLAVPAFYLIAKRRKLEPARLFMLLGLLLVAFVAAFAAFAYFAFYSLQAFGSSVLAGIAPILGFAGFSYLLLWLWRKYGSDHELRGVFSFREAAAILLIAVALRGLLMIAANFYFAGPLFFHVAPAELAAMISSVPVPFLGSSAWYASVFLWNALQGALEFALAWVIAFRFGFAEKYGA
jgi:riboflavin transporter FmnP